MENTKKYAVDYNNFATPFDVLKKHSVSVFEWKKAYYERDAVFKKLAPDMEQCMHELEHRMIQVPFQAKAIKDILEYWFPDIYLKVVLKDTQKKDRQELLKNAINRSEIEI